MGGRAGILQKVHREVLGLPEITTFEAIYLLMKLIQVEGKTFIS